MERKPILAGNTINSDVFNDETDIEGRISSLIDLGIGRSTLNELEDVFTYKFASLWALKYKTIKGKPTTYESKTNAFGNRPWQRAILDDTHPNKVVEKSRQLGMSEVGMTEMLHFLVTHKGVNGMYLFPRNLQMVDFSKSRIAPVFQDSKYFQSIIDKNINSVSTKKIGDNYLFLRSGWSSALGEGADLSILAIDEYDRMKEGVELSFQEGLSSSEYGYLRRWSTPTIPGRGINFLYQKSNQMRYMHTCPHCGHKQFLTFDDNLIQVKPNGVNNVTQEIEDGTFIIGCKKCKKELDRWKAGEWVAQYPSIKDIHGYHISQLDATWISADSIMRRKFSYSSKQLFYNYVIGEPYASEGLLITDSDIKSAIRLPREVLSRNSNYVAISVGIDWGEVSYMNIVGIKANGAVDLLNIYTVEDDNKIPLKSASFFAAILRAYTPNIIVADAGYGQDRNAYLFTQFPAAMYSCYWKTSTTPISRVRFKDQYNETAHEITVDKTIAIQRVLYSLKGQLIGLFPWNEKLALFTQHCKNTRIMDDEADGTIFSRATRIGPDHTACAMAYALIGVQKLTNYNIKFNTGTVFEFI